MERKNRLVVGLGNPGDGYADTYHNVGFIALDVLSARFSASDYRVEANALSADTVTAKGDRIIFIKPQTFMNLSGDAVLRFSRYYKIDPSDILVIYDDIDIKKGTVRARLNGSAGTHNGMRDIVAKLGSTDLARVRIGTGFKPNYMDLASYVLSHIPSAERDVINRAAAAAADFAEQWISGVKWETLTVDVTE